jgi:hypothetical protein
MEKHLVNQPSRMPTPKLSAAMISASLNRDRQGFRRQPLA